MIPRPGGWLLSLLVVLAVGASWAPARAQTNDATAFVTGAWRAGGFEPNLHAQVEALTTFEANGQFTMTAEAEAIIPLSWTQRGVWRAEVTPDGLIRVTFVVTERDGAHIAPITTEQVYEVIDDNTMRLEDDWRDVSIGHRVTDQAATPEQGAR